MGFGELESGILAELRTVAKDRSIKLKEIMEWSSCELKPHEGETLYFLPILGVWCCVKKEKKHEIKSEAVGSKGGVDENN